MTDFKDKQIEKLNAEISKLEGKSGAAVEKAMSKADKSLVAENDRHKSAVAFMADAAQAAAKKAAAKFQQKIDVLEKQLKALGGSR